MLIINFLSLTYFRKKYLIFKIYTQLQYNGLYPTGTVIYVYIVETFKLLYVLKRKRSLAILECKVSNRLTWFGCDRSSPGTEV